MTANKCFNRNNWFLEEWEVASNVQKSLKQSFAFRKFEGSVSELNIFITFQ